MNNTVAAIRKMAPDIAAALRLEPEVTPNLHDAELLTIVAMMMGAIDLGICTEDTIWSFLQARGCPFQRSTIRFLLDAFEGDDASRCFWRRDRSDLYWPMEAGLSHSYN